MAGNKGGTADDFDPKGLTKTVDQHQADLATLKSDIEELKGKKLDDKICKAITDSTHIQKAIGDICWDILKKRIVWIVMTLIALMLWENIKVFLGAVLQKIAH